MGLKSKSRMLSAAHQRTTTVLVTHSLPETPGKGGSVCLRWWCQGRVPVRHHFIGVGAQVESPVPLKHDLLKLLHILAVPSRPNLRVGRLLR